MGCEKQRDYKERINLATIIKDLQRGDRNIEAVVVVVVGEDVADVDVHIASSL